MRGPERRIPPTEYRPPKRQRILRVACLFGLLWAVGGMRLYAQSPDLALFRGLDFERQGRLEESVAAFRSVLEREPANIQALSGAERVYTQLGRRDSIAALVRRALIAEPLNTIARQIDVRVSRAMGGENLAAEALARWLAVAPTSEAPWREMIRMLLTTGQAEQAREAVNSARERLGASAMRPEMAQVEAATGNWSRSASEWRLAVIASPDAQTMAVFNLRGAPSNRQESVVRTLTEDTATAPKRLAAELLVGWNQAEQAWTLLQTALPREQDEKRAALQRFADRARAQEGAPPRRAAARALEMLATISGPAEATRWRIESARAWAEAGDAAAARRVLRALANDPSASADANISASATLVELYTREGNAAEAARALDQARDKLPGGEIARLSVLIARAWLQAGRLDQAERQVAPDSSLAGDEIRGWIALYRGYLAEARPLLRGGSMARSDPRGAVDRAAILELLSVVRTDTATALGAALLAVARGDTAGGVRALAAFARTSSAGQAEMLSLGARYLARGDAAGSEALWREIAERFPRSAPAPVAHLALARAMADRGDAAGAIRRLEALIIDYPQSAMVPEARRELDRIRGMIPRS